MINPLDPGRDTYLQGRLIAALKARDLRAVEAALSAGARANPLPAPRGANGRPRKLSEEEGFAPAPWVIQNHYPVVFLHTLMRAGAQLPLIDVPSYEPSTSLLALALRSGNTPAVDALLPLVKHLDVNEWKACLASPKPLHWFEHLRERGHEMPALLVPEMVVESLPHPRSQKLLPWLLDRPGVDRVGLLSLRGVLGGSLRPGSLLHLVDLVHAHHPDLHDQLLATHNLTVLYGVLNLLPYPKPAVLRQMLAHPVIRQGLETPIHQRTPLALLLSSGNASGAIQLAEAGARWPALAHDDETQESYFDRIAPGMRPNHNPKAKVSPQEVSQLWAMVQA